MTSPAGVAPMSGEEVSALERDGFVVLRSIMPASALDDVRAALAAVVDRLARAWQARGLIEDLHEDAPFETRWALIRRQHPAARPVSWRRILVSEGMYRLWQEPALTERIRTVLGDELWAYDVWNGRPREPGSGAQKIKWHQDAYYLKDWSPDDGPVLTCWMPLVPVDERSGCLQMLPGSHRVGLLPARYDEYLLRNSRPETIGGLTPVSVPVRPGDVVVFTDLTVHQALMNESAHVRWSVDIRFARATPSVRSKAVGGYLCRTSTGAVESYEAWAARYDVETGALGPELRAIDRAAARVPAMADDMRSY